MPDHIYNILTINDMANLQEEILGIIERDITQIGWDEHGNPEYNGFKHKAIEITTLINKDYIEKEFVKWKDNNVRYYNKITKLYWLGEMVNFTLEKLHEHWLKEIDK